MWKMNRRIYKWMIDDNILQTDGSTIPKQVYSLKQQKRLFLVLLLPAIKKFNIGCSNLWTTKSVKSQDSSVGIATDYGLVSNPDGG
jgi:hypothetical protein